MTDAIAVTAMVAVVMRAGWTLVRRMTRPEWWRLRRRRGGPEYEEVAQFFDHPFDFYVRRRIVGGKPLPSRRTVFLWSLAELLATIALVGAFAFWIWA